MSIKKNSKKKKKKKERKRNKGTSAVVNQRPFAPFHFPTSTFISSAMFSLHRAPTAEWHKGMWAPAPVNLLTAWEDWTFRKQQKKKRNVLMTIGRSVRILLIAIRQLVPADYPALNTLLTLVACRKK